MQFGGAFGKAVVRGDEPFALGQLTEGEAFFDELLLKVPVSPATRATRAMTTTVTISVRRRDCLRRSAAIACWRAWRPVFFRCRFCVAIGENRIRYRDRDRSIDESTRALSLVVQKFGGTSVADPDRIRAVADHVARTRRQGHDVVVV